MLNFDDADAEGVDDAVSYPDPNIDDDDTESFGGDNSNVEGIEGAILNRPCNLEGGRIDLAEGVGVHPATVVDRRPTFDVYAFGEERNY